MKTKTQILYRIREIEGEMNSLDPSSKLRIDYYTNLGRLKALNWVLNKD